MRVILLMLALPLALLICALLALALPLPAPLPPAWSHDRNKIAAILTGIVGALYMLGLMSYVVSLVLQPGRSLDAPFASMGLNGSSYMILGRQYQGVVQGRHVTVTFVPGRGLDPSQLNIYVSTKLDHRVAIGHSRPLLDCFNCEQLTVGDPDLGHLYILADDTRLAQDLLARADVQSILIRLMDSPDAMGQREIYVQPNQVWLHARPRQIAPAEFQQWIQDLSRLAGLTEKD